MNATSPGPGENGRQARQTAQARRIVAWLPRALGFGLLATTGGLLVGLGVLRMTSVIRLIPADGPQIWVESGCGAAEAAMRAALHATPEKPVFLIPRDQRKEITQEACRATLAALDHRGYWWLRHFPERWLCQRFADDANEYHDERITVPRFYAGGQVICDGICDGAFARIGHPELQQYVTVFSQPEDSEAPGESPDAE